jgi:hypothetical protein
MFPFHLLHLASSFGPVDPGVIRKQVQTGRGRLPSSVFRTDPGHNPDSSSETMLRRVMSRTDDDRIRRLLEMGRTLVAELDPEAVLDRILAEAREITGARYAALGVMTAERSELERFLTVGVDAPPIERSASCRTDAACSAF